MKKSKRSTVSRRWLARHYAVTLVVIILAIAGLALMQASRAAGATVAVEAESGLAAGAATSQSVATASGGSAVRFGGGITPPPTPPGPGPAPTGPIPATAKLLFNATYDDLSAFGNCQMTGYNSSCSGYSGDRLTLVDGGEGHTKAGRFELRKGDTAPGAGGNRTEVRLPSAVGDVKEGDERWYEFSVKFDDNFQNPSGGWFLIYQWHSKNPDSGSPPLGINVENNGDVVVGGDGGSGGKKVIGKLQKGKWVNYILHVKFGRSSSNSTINAWENGVQKISDWKRQSMSTDTNYLKSGIYRDSSNSSTSVVFHDDLRVWAP